VYVKQAFSTTLSTLWPLTRKVCVKGGSLLFIFDIKPRCCYINVMSFVNYVVGRLMVL
jgi:hypothetical protein